MAQHEKATAENIADQAERSQRVQAYAETARNLLDSGVSAYGDQLALLVREVHAPDPREVEEAIRQVRTSRDYGDGVSAPLRTPPF